MGATDQIAEGALDTREVLEGVSLDLELAVRRLRHDLNDDWFPDPIQFHDVLDAADFKRTLQLQSYRPSIGYPRDLPKPRFTLRCGVENTIQDRVVYQAVVDSLESLDSSLTDRVFGFRFQPGRAARMYRGGVAEWTAFNSEVESELRHAGPVLAATDVQNFFECIEHSRIVEEIENRDASLKPQAVLLGNLLGHWSTFKGFAIPQNRDASSFLANFHLAAVDDAMLRKGHHYFRYMDDIRVVCRDEFDARRALSDLICELRDRHLNVNSAKTAIVHRDSPEIGDHIFRPDAIIERFDATIKPKRQFTRPAVDALITHAQTLLDDDATDSRVMRACIDRLRRIANSEFAAWVDLSAIVQKLTRSLADHPWLTDRIVPFLEVAPLASADVDQLIEIVKRSDRYFYGWQAYHVWNLLLKRGIRDSALRVTAQLHASHANNTDELRQRGAILYLGACGSPNDRALIARDFFQYTSPFLRRACVIATQEITTSDSSRYLDRFMQNDEARLHTELKAKPAPVYATLPARSRLSDLMFDLPDQYV